MSKEKLLGYTPLLYRFQDDDVDNPHDRKPVSFLDAKEIRQSIVHELSLLLSTRTSGRGLNISLDDIDGLTVLNYGVVGSWGRLDGKHVDPADDSVWVEIATYLERLILYFEPRMRSVEVVIKSFNRQRQELHVEIQGVFKAGDLLEPLVFPIAINARG